MDYEKVRDWIERQGGAPKNIPKGKTVGTSGIDLLQSGYSGYPFGWGNCYGFVGLCIGQVPPKGGVPENFSLAAMKKEGVYLHAAERPSRKETDYKGAGGLQVQVVPEGGMLKLLLGGRRPTDNPGFGAIAIFKHERGIAHAGFVLGRNRAGDVVIIQKINEAKPCVISTVNHPLLKEFLEENGKPLYYQR